MLNVAPLAVAISLVAVSLGVALSTASDYSTGVNTDYQRVFTEIAPALQYLRTPIMEILLPMPMPSLCAG